VNQRFAVDGTRVYLTGHSGGARVAMEVALGKNRIAGVIASSAGFPDSQPRASVPFVVFGTAGTEDFNYIEMRLLDRALKTPHRVVIFPGGHTLPPDNVAMQAIEWLELQAMKSGLRPKDEALVTRLWGERQAAVAQSGESAATVHLLAGLTDDFTGLRDVAAEATRASTLSQRSDIKRALSRERADEDAELRLLTNFSQLEAGLGDSARRDDSLMSLRALLADLSKKATSATGSAERDRSRRVLFAITLGAAERVHDPEYLALIQRYRLPGGGRGGGSR
jgi:pimeloyl-ACP methyl ester carboxylesterase